MARLSRTSMEGYETTRPATSVDAKEGQLISLAMGLVEERLRNGTASPSETVHFLKLGSTKALLENEKLAEENKLLRAKTEALEAEKEYAIEYKEVLKAMRTYTGAYDDEDDPDNFDDYEDY